MVAEETGRPVRWTTELDATGWAVRTYSSTMKRRSRSRLSVSTSITLAISTRRVRVLTFFEIQRSIRAGRSQGRTHPLRPEGEAIAVDKGLDESGQKAQDYPARTGISAVRG